MRKLMFVIGVLALSVTIGSMTASAQTQISLDGTASGGAVFTPIAGGVSMDVTSAGTFSGPATGTGALFFPGIGTWTLTGGPVGLTLGVNDGATFANYVATSGSLTLDIVDGITTELSGTLNLVNLFQINNTGTTDTSLVANLTGISGALAPVFLSGSGVVQVDLNLSGPGVGYLPSLVGPSAPAGINHGFVATTPEPTSLLLLGTGILSLGGLLRRRVLAA